MRREGDLAVGVRGLAVRVPEWMRFLVHVDGRQASVGLMCLVSLPLPLKEVFLVPIVLAEPRI